MRSSNNLETKIPSDTYWRVQQVFMKDQGHTYVNHNWNTIRTKHLWRVKLGYDILNQLGSYRNIVRFQISSRRENR